MAPARENAFAPALCNRMNRNTGSIVIAAKNAEGSAHHKREDKGSAR